MDSCLRWRAAQLIEMETGQLFEMKVGICFKGDWRVA